MKDAMTTTTLFRMLRKAPSMEAAANALKEDPGLSASLRSLLAEKEMDIPNLAQAMFASKTYVYQMFEGKRRPGRNMLLRAAFALGLNVEKTQRLLALAQRGTLYSRLRRDRAILYALEHSLSLTEVDEALLALGEEGLLSPKE